ncbi:MAG: hypothetical protein ACYSXF_05625 [Planctomycetota bacterium]|jgi:hypothetical protein
MGLFVDRRKLTAASRSMAQYLPVVRSIFRGDVSDQVVESAAVYLYTQLAQDIFSRRFASLLRKNLIRTPKFMSSGELRARLGRIDREVVDFERAGKATIGMQSPDKRFEAFVRSVIQSLLLEAGMRSDDVDLIKETFTRFEEAVREIRRHLVGIKQQNFFVMK